MKQQNKVYLIFLLALILVSVYIVGDFLSSEFGVVSIDGNGVEVGALVLNSDSVSIEKITSPLASRILQIKKIEGAEYFTIMIYPDYDRYTPIYTTTRTASSVKENYISLIIIDSKYEVYQNITISIIAYSQDKTVASEPYNISIDYLMDKYQPEDEGGSSSGIVDEIENDDYYYSYIYDTVCLPSSNKTKDYAFLVKSESPIYKVNAVNITENDYKYDDENNLLIFKNEYISSFVINSCVSIEIVYDDFSTKHFTIVLSKEPPYALSSNVVSYIKYSSLAPAVTVYSGSEKTTGIRNIVVDGIQYSTSANVASISNNKVQFNAAFLDILKEGDHEVKLYFGTVASSIRFTSLTIVVEDKTQTPHNLKINYDDPFKTLISWETSVDWDRAEVLIGDQTYDSSDLEFSSLFENNTFNAKLYLKTKGTKVSVKLYKDGVAYSTPDENCVTLDINLNESLVCEYINNTFEFLGDSYNCFISSLDELNIFTAYNAIHYGDDDDFRQVQTNIEETYSICSPFLISISENNKSTIQSYLSKSYTEFVEPVRVYIALEDIDITGNIITYTVNQASGGTRPYDRMDSTNAVEQSKYVEYPYSQLHYYTNGESQRTNSYVFPVDKIEKEATVETSVELYLALEKGVKPIVKAGSNAEMIYNKAREILIEIVDDRMNDYEKVLAIYDWISYNTVYDMGLKKTISQCSTDLRSTRYVSLFKNTSFFAEGVFKYGIAQCNGLAAAFSIMCNIEGIKCIKTMGTVSSGAHAWIKVMVDGEWFLCDPTWSSPYINDSASFSDMAEGKIYEYISYDYFMINKEEASYGSRKEYTYGEAAKYYIGGSCKAQSVMYFEYEGKEYDYIIESLEEFKTLIAYYTQDGENAVIKDSDVVLFSIKGSLASSIIGWMDDGYVTGYEGKFKIEYFVRKLNNSTILNYNDVTYFRITRETYE